VLKPVGDDHRQGGGGITATAAAPGPARALEGGRARAAAGSPGRQPAKPAKLAEGAGLADLAKLAHLADGRQPVGDDHRQAGRRVGSLTIARHGASQGGGGIATADGEAGGQGRAWRTC